MDLFCFKMAVLVCMEEDGGVGSLTSLSNLVFWENKTEGSEACSSSFTASLVMKSKRIKVEPETKVQFPIRPDPQG